MKAVYLRSQEEQHAGASSTPSSVTVLPSNPSIPSSCVRSPARDKKMKRYFLMNQAVVLLFSVASCGAYGQITAPNSPKGEPSKQQGQKRRIKSKNLVKPITQEELDAMNAYREMRELFDAAFKEGRLADARKISRYLLSKNPEDDSVACCLADVCFREGRYDEAYSIMAPFLQEQAQERVVLRVSLAAAHRSQSVKGTEEDCRKVLSRHFSASDLEGSLPPVGVKNSVELTALLALGVTSAPNGDRDAWGSLYYGLALKLDPLNPLANLCLGNIEKHQRRWDQAISRYEIVLRRGSERLQKGVRRRIEELESARAMDGIKPTSPTKG